MFHSEENGTTSDGRGSSSVADCICPEGEGSKPAYASPPCPRSPDHRNLLQCADFFLHDLSSGHELCAWMRLAIASFRATLSLSLALSLALATAVRSLPSSLSLSHFRSLSPSWAFRLACHCGILIPTIKVPMTGVERQLQQLRHIRCPSHASRLLPGPCVLRSLHASRLQQHLPMQCRSLLCIIIVEMRLQAGYMTLHAGDPLSHDCIWNCYLVTIRLV